jgi:hypothetical protein
MSPVKDFNTVDEVVEYMLEKARHYRLEKEVLRTYRELARTSRATTIADHEHCAWEALREWDI